MSQQLISPFEAGLPLFRVEPKPFVLAEGLTVVTRLSGERIITRVTKDGSKPIEFNLDLDAYELLLTTLKNGRPLETVMKFYKGVIVD